MAPKQGCWGKREARNHVAFVCATYVTSTSARPPGEKLCDSPPTGDSRLPPTNKFATNGHVTLLGLPVATRYVGALEVANDANPNCFFDALNLFRTTVIFFCHSLSPPSPLF